MGSRIRVVSCICLIGFLEAIVYGLSFPFFSVRLERAGLSPSLIGLNATVGAAGVLLCGHLFPRFILRWGYRGFSVAAFAGAMASIAGLLISNNVVFWFVLRLLLGISLAGLWVSTEAWLNHVVADSHRGRANAIFQALYSLGFLLGPSATYITGYAGLRPILTMIVLCGLALGVLGFAAGSVAIDPDTEEQIRWRDFPRLSGARGILLIAVLVGVCETAVYALLPVFGMHRGLSTQAAVGVLVAYTLGEVIIALPIGWLADRVSREAILAFCASVASVCVLGLAAVIQTGPYALATAFVAGGLIVSLYNIALVLLGERFSEANLPLLSTAFSMAYSIGSAVGSTVGGTTMDVFGPNGFPISIGLALAFASVVLIRRFARRDRTRAAVPVESGEPVGSH